MVIMETETSETDDALPRLPEEMSGMQIIANEMNEYLRRHNLTLRSAETHFRAKGLEISMNTVHTLSRGGAVRPQMAAQVAKVIGADPVLWRGLAAGVPPAYLLPAAVPYDLPSNARKQILEAMSRLAQSELVPVPIVGRVSAGRPLLAMENVDGYVTVSPKIAKRGEDVFAVRVEGNSLEGAAILAGDIVILRPAPIAEDRQIVAALIGEEVVLKRLRRPEGEPPYLESVYEGGKTERLPYAIGTSDGDARILGVYRALRRED